MTANTTFPQFPRLPTELRRMIWNRVLPDPTRPTLYQYEPGHSHWRIIDDLNQRTGEVRRMVRMWWSRDLLRNHAIPASLAVVNHEARLVVLRWLSDQRSKLRLYGPLSRPVFLREFEAQRDAIFVRLDQLAEACKDQYTPRPKPGWNLARMPQRTSGGIGQLAVPDALFYTESIADVLRYTAWTGVRIIWIVIDPPTLLLDTSKRLSLPYFEFDEPRYGTYRSEGRYQPWIFTPGAVSPIPRLHNLINAWISLATQDKVVPPGIFMEIRPVDVSRRRN